VTTEFRRSSWSTTDAVAQVWVDELIWKMLRCCAAEEELGTATIPTASGSSVELYKTAHAVVAAHGLLGVADLVYGRQLLDLKDVGAYWVDDAEKSRKRSDILNHELNWLVSPKLGGRVLAIDSAGMRSLYASISKEKNPRHMDFLCLWAPTLDSREELGELLKLGAYEAIFTSREEGSVYRYQKNTNGIFHRVEIRSVLWPTSKNWSTDIERAIWDRAKEDSAGRLILDATDLFTLALRQFAVDSLLGGAAPLLDMLRILKKYDDNIDWQRLRQYKNQLGKCEWMWAGLYAIDLFEKKTGVGLRLPTWARENLVGMRESFWPTFVDSRLVWANPDTRLGEFARAHVKLARGT